MIAQFLAFLGRAVASKTVQRVVAGAVRKAPKEKMVASAVRGSPHHVVRPEGVSRVERARDAVWAAESAANLIERLKGMVDGSLPSFAHSISVSVKGGPEADLRRVWYLCLAAAFGRYRNRALGIQHAEIEATWDVTGKACSVTIGYLNSGVPDAIVRSNPFGGPEATSGLGLIQQGPDQVTIGGSWPAFTWMGGQRGTITSSAVVTGGILGTPTSLWSRIISGVLPIIRPTEVEPGGAVSNPWRRVAYYCNGQGAAGAQNTRGLVLFQGSDSDIINVVRELPYVRKSLGGGSITLPWRRVVPSGLSGLAYYSQIGSSLGLIPVLPDDGRLITTGEKRDYRVQNPRPPIDGVSRGSLVSLVSQALQQPCFLPNPVPCAGTVGSPGLQFYAPGTSQDLLTYQDPKIQRVVVGEADRPFSNGTDGLARLPQSPLGPDQYSKLPPEVVQVK